MLRHLIRVAALVTALAVPGTALAAPTKPELAWYPNTIYTPLIDVQWSPSTFDAGFGLKYYQLRLSDLTAGTLKKYAVFGNGKIVSVTQGHCYFVFVRAAETNWGGPQLLSNWDLDWFCVGDFAFDDIALEEYLSFGPPPPDCPRCGPDEIVFEDDQVIPETREIIASAGPYDPDHVPGVYVDRFGEAMLR